MLLSYKGISSTFMFIRVTVALFVAWALVPCAKKVQQVTPQALPPTTATRAWSEVHPPFKSTNITALGNTFWLCGPEEMIASSSDGGATWVLRHQNPGGHTLLNIEFVNEEVGHASGEGGMIFATTDGGKTWVPHNAGGTDAVQAFSFADALHGIAVLTNHTEDPQWGILGEVEGVPFLESDVKLTRDGGEHWENIFALNTDDQLKLYTEVLSVAALDSRHYLVGIRQPNVAVGYAVTTDGGATWKLVHVTDVYATKVFVHNNEYWAFGIEIPNGTNLLQRPVSLHSKDGVSWVHGVGGPSEFHVCNSQGCFLWDGTVESLYGDREKFWALPQDSRMSTIWAVAGNRACTVADGLKCGPAVVTEQPQPLPKPKPVEVESRSTPSPSFRVGLPDGCIQCALNPIPWKIEQRHVLWILASLTVGPDGSVANVVLSQQLDESDFPITQQLKQWRFQSSTDGLETKKSVRLIVQCGFEAGVCRIVPTIPAQKGN